MFIYGLIDPRTNALRYVGESYRPKRRLGEHVALARISPNNRRRVVRWVRSLLKVQMLPLLEILEEVPDEAANDAERFWIASLRAAGAQLLNMATGGEGGGPLTEAARQKLRQRTFSAEHRAKIGAASRLRTSPRFRALNESRRGQALSTEHRNKIRASVTKLFADQTTCCRGHLYTEANTYRKANGTKCCRECRRAADQRRTEARC